MGSFRPRLTCTNCRYSWFARGSDISRQCPNCKAKIVGIKQGFWSVLFWGRRYAPSELIPKPVSENAKPLAVQKNVLPMTQKFETPVGMSPLKKVLIAILAIPAALFAIVFAVSLYLVATKQAPDISTNALDVKPARVSASRVEAPDSTATPDEALVKVRAGDADYIAKCFNGTAARAKKAYLKRTYEVWKTDDGKVDVLCSCPNCSTMAQAIEVTLLVQGEIAELCRLKCPMDSAGVAIAYGKSTAEIELFLSDCEFMAFEKEGKGVVSDSTIANLTTRLKRRQELKTLFAARETPDDFTTTVTKAAAPTGTSTVSAPAENGSQRSIDSGARPHLLGGISATQVGPRGGVFHRSASGKKVYEKK